MDNDEKIKFVANELTAIYEEYEAVIELQLLVKKFLKLLIESVNEKESPYIMNENGEYVLSEEEPFLKAEYVSGL